MPDEITPVMLELADPNGPFGARGMAEMPLVPFAAAVAARHPRGHRRLAHPAAHDPRARPDRPAYLTPDPVSIPATRVRLPSPAKYRDCPLKQEQSLQEMQGTSPAGM